LETFPEKDRLYIKTIYRLETALNAAQDHVQRLFRALGEAQQARDQADAARQRAEDERDAARQRADDLLTTCADQQKELYELWQELIERRQQAEVDEQCIRDLGDENERLRREL
jgi:hypothetical protein